MSTPPVLKIPDLPTGSNQAHRRQVIWQIWVPLGLTAILFLAICVFVVLGASRSTFDTGLGMSVSVIFMILPVIFISLIVLVILAGLVYLMARLLGILPAYTRLGQAYVNYFGEWVRYAAGKTTRPVLAVQGSVASGKKFFSRLFRR